MSPSFCPECGSMIFDARRGCPECRRRSANRSAAQPASVSGDSVPDVRGMSLDDLMERMGADSSDAKGPEVVSSLNPKAPYLPYRPRSTQIQIISDIRSALDAGKHIVMESGTGTGKTIVSLAATLEHAVPRQKKIIYLTRTITQSDQVMKELRAISKLKPISGIPVTGRGKSCILARTNPEFQKLPPNVLSNICEEHKAKHKCPYFETISENLEPVGEYVRTQFPKSDELDNFCQKRGTCPYEMKKLLMKDCDVVAAPYVHVLSDDIRSNFLRNLDVESDKVVLIIDEAHNLVDAARDQESFEITMKTVENAVDECSTMKGGDAYVFKDVRLLPFLQFFKRILKGIATEFLPMGQKEAVLDPPTAVEDRIMQKFGITRDDLSMLLDNVEDIGQSRTERLLEEGENTVSAIEQLAHALKMWMLTPNDYFIRTVKTDDDGEYFRASCINPSDVVRFIRMQPGAVHMSGTLQPLEQYVRVLGLPSDTVTRTYPSPFPKENRKVVYMTNVTTRYQDMQKNPAIFNIMERTTAKLCNLVRKNTLVFFPSYKMMKDMRPFLERDVRKPLYWEESGKSAKTAEALVRFRSGRDGVFCSVMGGSVAEGMDFPGDELCFAIIIGIPFPPPTLENDAMSRMYDEKYGPWKGWTYVSLAPAMRKMQQAIGRLIRTETDRGMAVIMDSRASKYASQLDAVATQDVLSEAERFFSRSVS